MIIHCLLRLVVYNHKLPPAGIDQKANTLTRLTQQPVKAVTKFGSSVLEASQESNTLLKLG
ncbi:hypothetical protein [Nostoc sp.]|uniref:hypothetical protein n=1 Tax=Nostoc sp. TaxID=1180 RepID=UPI002FF9B000